MPEVELSRVCNTALYLIELLFEDVMESPEDASHVVPLSMLVCRVMVSESAFEAGVNVTVALIVPHSTALARFKGWEIK